MEARPFGMDPLLEQGPRLGPIDVEGRELGQLQSRYVDRGGVGEEQWDEVVRTAAKALAHCPDPSGPPCRATGIALGKVQSGKTLSYTALTALAADNRYRITVVLAGTKKPLLEQTYARLVHDLDAGRGSLVPFQNPPPQDSDVVCSVLHGGGHALIVVLKHRKRIEDVRKLLASPELRDFPTLIIDDEGDEASLNTQFRAGRRSSIYASILQLRDALPFHAYIAYTATPQANLLISGIDALSPDFAVLVQPGTGYCGGSVFFGEHSDQYVSVIPADQGDPDRAPEITPGLKRGLATFVAGAAIRSVRGAASPHSMLVHTSNLRADHAKLQSSVRQLILLWREIVKLPETDPAAGELLSVFRDAYDDLCNTVQNPPPWDAIKQRLRDEVWLTEVWMVNSLPLGRDPIATPFRLRNNVFVGGNMLGRGVTIPGLAVTYITREAQRETNADTLEQRARWFGYKQDYLDLCRIFLTGRLKSRYTELLRHEDDFWEALRRNERQGLSIRDWPRMFRLDMQGWEVRPTRPNVASYRQFHGEGWDVQNRVIDDPAVALRNIELVRDFFARHPGDIRRYGNVEHLVAQDLSPAVVIAEFLAGLEMEGTDWEKAYVEEYLARLLLGGQLDRMDVLLMSRGEFRDRTLNQQGLVNPMQGRSPHRQAGDPDFYPGDQHIHGQRVQLQVHLIRLRGSDTRSPVETTAVALYIPDDPRYDLRAVVRGYETP